MILSRWAWFDAYPGTRSKTGMTCLHSDLIGVRVKPCVGLITTSSQVVCNEHACSSLIALDMA